MIKAENITPKEKELFSYQVDQLSDMDYSYNHETGEYDVPAVEMDGPYGKHWHRFESEEARTEFLDKREKDNEIALHEFVIYYRKEQIKKGQKIQAQKRRLKEAKTLGGQYPILQQLLTEMH